MNESIDEKRNIYSYNGLNYIADINNFQNFLDKSFDSNLGQKKK